jgi:hypothetical protein
MVKISNFAIGICRHAGKLSNIALQLLSRSSLFLDLARILLQRLSVIECPLIADVIATGWYPAIR